MENNKKVIELVGNPINKDEYYQFAIIKNGYIMLVEKDYLEKQETIMTISKENLEKILKALSE